MRLRRLLPGVDADLLDGWIADRYQRILDALAWKRRTIQTTLQTVAPYSTGTVSATAGSTTVTGSGTTWTATHTGIRLRFTGREEWYTFTRTGATAGTLDRPFEGTTGSGLSYTLYQPLLTLPSDCRIVAGDLLEMQTGAPIHPEPELRDTGATGPPQYYRAVMDSTGTPPQMRLELWPAPDAVRSIRIEYTAEDTAFAQGVDSSTSASMLPWVREGCLVAGVEDDGRTHMATLDPAHAAVHLQAAGKAGLRYEAQLEDMKRTAMANIPPQRLKLAPRYQVRRMSSNRTSFTL